MSIRELEPDLAGRGLRIGVVQSRFNEDVGAGLRSGCLAELARLGVADTDITCTTVPGALELPLVRANFFTYLPFPGTESYRQLEESGELDKVDWERFFFMNAAYTPRGFTRAEIKAIQRRAFLRFYLRPRVFWKNITAIKSLRHLWFLARRFLHWM